MATKIIEVYRIIVVGTKSGSRRVIPLEFFKQRPVYLLKFGFQCLKMVKKVEKSFWSKFVNQI